MVVEVIYEKGVFKPIGQIEGFQEGEKLDVEILPTGYHWKGALKDLKLTSVELKHKIKDEWGKKNVSN